MKPIQAYSLDTRLGRFAATVELDGATAPVDLMAFDVPDDLSGAVGVSLVLQGSRLAGAGDVGWRAGDRLVDRVEARAGDRLTLAASPAALAALLADLRTTTDPSDGAIELGFSTIVEAATGPRASPRRMLHLTVLAGASRPSWTTEALAIDLDRLPAIDPTLLRLAIAMPDDIVLETRRGFIVETCCEGLGAHALSLRSAAGSSLSARRLDDHDGRARHLVWIADARSVAGQSLDLNVTVAREALLDHVDDLATLGSAAPTLPLDLRLEGWVSQDGASDAERRWIGPRERVAVPLGGGQSGDAALVIAGSALPCPFEDPPLGVALPVALPASFDPAEDVSGLVRCPPLTIEVRRWPVARASALTIAVRTTLAGSQVEERPQRMMLELVRDGETGRRGRTEIPMQALAAALSRLVASASGRDAAMGARIEVAFIQADSAQPVASATLGLSLERRVHRLPICIDLGATATAVWAGRPAPAGSASEIRPLPLGAWLRLIDPEHAEAETGDELIPSTIGLDSRDHLRTAHAPQTLSDIDLIGADRPSVTRRLTHFRRRYDVSVPAPPRAGAVLSSGRIDSLKEALLAGAATLPLTQPINALDPATGRAATVHQVETAPLVADVLDELVDLYLPRMGEAEAAAGDLAEAPIVPRIVLTRPSGIGEEIATRYRAALDLFRQRLERLYPGTGSQADVTTTVPEAVAAARHLAGRPEIMRLLGEGEEALLVAVDIGGGTSDVALSRLRRDGTQVKHVPLATFGLFVGGDAIDEALATVCAEAIDVAVERGPRGWRPSFPGRSLARALGQGDASASRAGASLRQAVRRAKSQLSAALRARDGAYAWAADDPIRLEVVLGRSGDETGLFVRQDEPADGQGTLRTVRNGEDDVLVLSLGRAEIEGTGSAASSRLSELAAVLGGLLPRMARAAAPNPGRRPRLILAPTGRGALWPPLFSAAAEEARASRAEFPYASPLSPAEMKKAVIAGAALLGLEDARDSVAVALPNPIGIAAMAAHSRDVGGGVRTEFVAARVHYLGYDLGEGGRIHAQHDDVAPGLGGRADLGQRFRFVRTVPGLDPQGRLIERLRGVLDGVDPILPLEGEGLVEAYREGIDSFGVCGILSEVVAPGTRRVTVTAGDADWRGVWRIEAGRAIREA